MTNGRTTKSRGVKTDGGRVENIQEELENVINLMGNEEENSLSESHLHSGSSILELCPEEKEVIHNLVQQPNAKPISVANTPRDYSDLSSLATDSIAVYLERSDCEQIIPDKKISELALKIRNPIQTISSLLGVGLNGKSNNPVQNGSAQNQLPSNNIDLYRINIHQPKSESAPKRVIFDLVEDFPPTCSNAATNTTPRTRTRGRRQEAKLIYRNANCKSESQALRSKPMTQMQSDPLIDPGARMQKKTIYQRTAISKAPGHLDSITRVDVYYFDHGNSAYYHTTDCPPLITTEIVAEKTEIYTTKFWAETFGFIHILFSFFTSFILQLLRSVLQSFVRPLTVGILQIVSDYCIKPLLATVFNALIQPPLIFLYNIATTIRDICDPIAEGFGYFVREIAHLFGAIRLIDVKHYGSKARKKSIKDFEAKETTEI